MTQVRQRAVVVCPGRGVYNRGELGYLARLHADPDGPAAELLDVIDAYRVDQGLLTVRELDAAPAYSPALHARGDNASPLIFACSLADFAAIDRHAFDVVAVTGNSMGWYTALACAGALSPAAAVRLVDTMGRLMHEASIGGQAIYSVVDDDWRSLPERRAQLLDRIADIGARPGHALSVSIELGGMVVVAGDQPGLDALQAKAPPQPDRFPLVLAGHAAYHSPLQAPVAERARSLLPPADFTGPALPLIDGQGRLWRPHAVDPFAMWDYTLGAQVTETYDFTAALRVAMREFAPDRVIVLGPGDTLGGAVAQALIAHGWRGLDGKAAFARLQGESPFVAAMGRADQRAIAAMR